MSWHDRIKALACALVALMVASGAGSAAWAADTIRVAFVSTSLASIPIIIADAKGFFTEQGLDAKLIRSEASQPIALAIASGDADFGTTGLSEPFFVLGNQGTIRIIGGDTVEHKGFHGLGFIASNQAYAAGLTSLKLVGGHSVGVTQAGSPLEYSLALVLDKYGIDFKTVRVMALQSNGNVSSALAGGQIDFTVQSSANLYQNVTRGTGKLLGWLDEEVHGADVSGTVISAKLADGQPDVVHRFLAAFRKAAQTWDSTFLDANGNRFDQPDAPAMIELMAKGLGQPTEVVRLGLNYVDPEARVSIGDIQRMLDWYEVRGMQKIHIDAKALVDMRYAKLFPPRKE